MLLLIVEIPFQDFLRDRPFNLRGRGGGGGGGGGGGMVICIVQNFFCPTTQELEYFFFQYLTLGYMTKTLNQIIFVFLHQNQNIFFSNIWNQNIFLDKNHNSPPPPPPPPLFKLNGRSLSDTNIITCI